MKCKKVLFIISTLLVYMLNAKTLVFADMYTLDWRGYLRYMGYPENEMPDSLNENELREVYNHWMRTVVEETRQEAENNPYLETYEAKQKYVRDTVLAIAPEARYLLGLPPEIKDRDEPYRFANFQTFVRNNAGINDMSLSIGSFISQYTRTIINEQTRWIRPFLANMSEAEFAQRFRERNRLNDSMTVAAILAANPVVGVVSPTPRSSTREESKSPLGKLKSGVKEKIRKMVE